MALGEKLEELNRSFSKDDAVTSSFKCHDIIGDIGRICLHEISEKDIGYCASIVCFLALSLNIRLNIDPGNHALARADISSSCHFPELLLTRAVISFSCH